MFTNNLRDDYEICPYDSNHCVQKKSILAHLVKCRQNHPESKKIPCKFNHTHLIPKLEMPFHLTECPSRHIIDSERKVLASEHINRGQVQAPQIKNHLLDDSENWEEELPVRTNALFNPWNKEATLPELRRPVIPGANFVTRTPDLNSLSTEKIKTAKNLPSNEIFEYSKAQLMKPSNNFPLGRGRGVLCLRHSTNNDAIVGSGDLMFDQSMENPALATSEVKVLIGTNKQMDCQDDYAKALDSLKAKQAVELDIMHRKHEQELEHLKNLFQHDQFVD